MAIRRIIVGRSPTADYVVNDRYVSKSHLEFIIYEDGSVGVRDLGSRTGTYVNGQRIVMEHRLAPHDIIKIGQTYLPWKEIVGPPKKQNWLNNIKNQNNLALYIGGGVLALLLLAGLFWWMGNKNFKTYTYYGYTIKVHKDLRRSHKSNKYAQIFRNRGKDLEVEIVKMKKSKSSYKHIDDLYDAIMEEASDKDLDVESVETKINGRKAYIMEYLDYDDEDGYVIQGLIEGKRYFYAINTMRPDKEEYRSAMLKTIKSLKEK